MFAQAIGIVLMLFMAVIANSFKLKLANRFVTSFRPLLSDQTGEGVGDDLQKPPRSLEPSRRDVCQILISGVVGTDMKDRYLSNGHYVLDFGLAIVGHFNYVHEWERYKPTETMWITTEVWDDLAKNNPLAFRKGTPLYGFGYLIFNKWTDKNTGEERKAFKLRLTKLLPEAEFSELSNSLALEVNADDLSSSGATTGGSQFRDPEPIISSQIPPASGYSRQQASAGPTSFSNYRPRAPPSTNNQNAVDPRRIPF